MDAARDFPQRKTSSPASRGSLGSLVAAGGSCQERYRLNLLARGGLVHVPQGRQIVPTLTVRQNLVVAAESAGHREKPDLAGQLDREFNRFPVLGERMDIPGGNLSGGQQQMLAVSRALMMKPKAIMLDEPSLGLAPKAVALIPKALQSLANAGLSVLLVEQLAMLALEVADHAYVLQRGKIVISGPAADLERDPKLVESYLS